MNVQRRVALMLHLTTWPFIAHLLPTTLLCYMMSGVKLEKHESPIHAISLFIPVQQRLHHSEVHYSNSFHLRQSIN